MKKVLTVVGIIVLFLVVWITAGMLASAQFGPVGFGFTLLLGFIAFPIVIRIVVTKLFKADQKRPERM